MLTYAQTTPRGMSGHWLDVEVRGLLAPGPWKALRVWGPKPCGSRIARGASLISLGGPSSTTSCFLLADSIARCLARPAPRTHQQLSAFGHPHAPDPRQPCPQRARDLGGIRYVDIPDDPHEVAGTVGTVIDVVRDVSLRELSIGVEGLALLRHLYEGTDDVADQHPAGEDAPLVVTPREDSRPSCRIGGSADVPLRRLPPSWPWPAGARE